MERIDTVKPILGIWKELPKVSSVPCGKINRTRNTLTMYFFCWTKISPICLEASPAGIYHNKAHTVHAECRGHPYHDMYTLDEGKMKGVGRRMRLFLSVGHW